MASRYQQQNSDGESDDDVVILDREDVRDFNEDEVLPQPPEILEEIRKWLKPTAYEDAGSEYKKHSASHLPGTGNWLSSSDTYQKWHSSQEDGTLWIRGIPGSGKSVFAANLVDQLKQEYHPVLYFFFRQIVDANHNAVAALRDWLDQILVFSPPLQMKLAQHIETNRPLESLSMDDIWDLLRDALSYLPRAYIIVDALDEMDQDQDLEPFLKSLTELGAWQPGRIKVIMTSRPIAYIERCLQTAKILNIRLEEKKVDVDIAAYVRHRLKDSDIPIEARVLVEKAVPGNANGLFLFAKLAMDAFLQPGVDVEITVQKLPKDLNNVYIDLLKNHSKRSGIPDNVQLLILQFVTHATRPIRLLEMAEILNTTEYSQDKRDLKEMKNMVRSACGPLLEILLDETVSVVHHSFTEFLNGTTRKFDSSGYHVLQPGPTHHRLALICLSYLKSCMSDTNNHPILDSPYAEKFNSLPPFTQYASQNWHIHVQKAALGNHDMTEIHSFLDSFFDEKTLERLRNFVDDELIYNSVISFDTPLFTAVSLGLSSYVKHLLADVNNKQEIIMKDKHGDSAPCYAAQKGYDDIVEMLLQTGVDPNGPGANGETPLVVATIYNHPKVIKLLIGVGVDPFKPVKYARHNNSRARRISWRHGTKESPFELAGRFNHAEAMATYYPYVTTAEQANSILSWAVFHGNLRAVKIYIQHPMFDANWKTEEGQTHLYRACSSSRVEDGEEIVKLLVQAGADPNILCKARVRGRRAGKHAAGTATAMYTLVASNNRVERDGPPRWSRKLHDTKVKERVKLLLDAGADVNQKASNGNTVLHQIGEAAVARLILEAGADPNAVNNEGVTPLHTCGDMETLEVLLADARTNIEIKDLEGSTPLLHALKSHRTDIALHLLDRGADVNTVDNFGNGVWHHAFPMLIIRYTFDSKILRHLSEAGANPNARNQNGRTFAHDIMTRCTTIHAYPEEFEEALNYAISIGADLEAKDNSGETALHRFMRTFGSNHIQEEFNLLLKGGARTDTLDFKGKNLYHACLRSVTCWHDPKAIFKLLSNNNIDPKHVDYEGNTLLHEASMVSGSLNRDGSIVYPSILMRELEKFGIDPNSRNNLGRTPLHIACMYRIHRSEIFDRGAYREDSLGISMVRYLLEQKVDIDLADIYGFTALHFASTCCELNTDMLLSAGANVSKVTHEGLTALHLAARSRQVNILGMLLDSLKSQTTSEEFLRVINAKDYSLEDATALYYACASGHPMTVKLLLEAGATVETPSITGSPWIACAGFEEEERNWRRIKRYEGDDAASERSADFLDCEYRNRRTYYDRTSEENDDMEPDAKGLLLEDKTRPDVPENTYFETRLEEILDLLVQYGSTKYIDDAIFLASAQSFDYTVDRLNAKLEDSVVGLRTKLCLKRIEAQRQALSDALSSSQELKPKYHLLMSLREYDLVSRLLQETDFTEIDEPKAYIIYDLLENGLAFILKSFLTKDIVSDLYEWEKWQRQKKSLLNEHGLRKPLLLEACRTPFLNMDFIRFLIEELGVDINTRCVESSVKKYSAENGRIQEIEYVDDETALSVIMIQNRWWQVAHALPYFIEHGADIEARDRRGYTPLHAGVSCLKMKYPLTQRAIKKIVSHGANPETACVDGNTCLAAASCNMDILRLFLQHGMEIKPGVLLTAISNEQHDILEALLAAGANPNERNIIEDGEERMQAESHESLYIINWDEMYPLHFTTYQDRINPENPEDRTKAVKILLKYGADPFAKYPRSTILHQVVASARIDYLSVFMALPDLKLEERDADGYTILLRACQRRSWEQTGCEALDRPLVEVLVDRGADIHAQTNNGRTILHILTESYTRSDPITLKFALERAPGLINVADNDGNTPLHFAVGRSDFYHNNAIEAVMALLSVGADPRTPNKKGETVLHMLAGKGWTLDENGDLNLAKRELFETILNKGVDVNARDNRGETALFRFFHSGSVSQGLSSSEGSYYSRHSSRNQRRTDISELPVLEMFDRAGMDWKAINNANETLLHVVASNDRGYVKSWPKRSVKRFIFLMEKGVDVTVEDEKNRTALDIAAIHEAKEILDLFSRDPQANKKGIFDGFE
ncbi:hypothetical protein TWF694_009306 [Orbilia ellipsospora]|uniref:NACHT domain-containing protein n=1 Tax=Orbilia ellipsospora TaxID=2528407 RepID=A0AAV9XEH8_9PEZI